MGDRDTVITYSAATRQLQALVRKYNQATRTNQGYTLTIAIDKYNTLQVITYTLIMKNDLDDTWEVRRISSTLNNDIQTDFTEMVTCMEVSLESAIHSRTNDLF